MITSVVTNMVVCLAITTTHTFIAKTAESNIVPKETNRVEVCYIPIDNEQRDPTPKGQNKRTRGLAWRWNTADGGIRWSYGTITKAPKIIPLYLYEEVKKRHEMSKKPIGWIDRDAYIEEQGYLMQKMLDDMQVEVIMR